MKRLALFCSAIIFVLAQAGFAELPEVTRSFYHLPFSNGVGAGIYQARPNGGRLLYFYESIYKQYSEDSPLTRSYLRRKGVTWGINNTWLDDAPVSDAEYIDGTGIVRVFKEVPKNRNISAVEYYYMPMELDKRIIVTVLEFENTGLFRKRIKPYIYVDANMGAREKVRREDNFFIQGLDMEAPRREPKSFVILSPEVSSFSYKPLSQYPREVRERPVELDNKLVKSGRSLIGVLQFDEITLRRGEKARVMVVLGLADKEEEAEYKSDMQKIFDKTAEVAIGEEMKWWDDWHAVAKIPDWLSYEEKRLYRQSAAVLKMGQCREPGKPYGQILASLPPGNWNICWPRDATYGLVALAQMGHFYEAKAGLEFMLNAPNGKFDSKEFVGVPYKISVCRYYGNGDEESDENQSGPNLEWDNFGLVLWAICEYLDQSGDKEFLDKHYKTIKELIADVIVHLMTDKGYLRRDSSIWERHWEPQIHPDGRKYFAYSTINGYHALKRFAKYCPPATEAHYLKMAEKIKEGFLNHFIDENNNVIVANLEEKPQGINHYMDASVVEAINFGMVDETVAKATLQAFEDKLGMRRSPGFHRNDDGTWYDRQEWLIIDMRIAQAYYLMGNKERAQELMDWVLLNAKNNFYLIPELLDERNLSFKGEVPMVGFGPGCYIINKFLIEK
jgi:GH15 family glucan-1,4-alpha-glucosidase